MKKRATPSTRNGQATDRHPEVTRLEGIWSGDFGDAYVERNRAAGAVRAPFWRELLGQHPIGSVLEVGCNLGTNLQWLAKLIPPQAVYGIDVNRKALALLRSSLPDVNAVYSPARELPFRDRLFDLTFTMGVLIHMPESTLPLVMGEIVRCSRRYVLAGEYYAETTTEVPYRGQQGALFKRDYGRLYAELFPQMRLIDHGFLGRDQGWDDVTWWLFEKTDGATSIVTAPRQRGKAVATAPKRAGRGAAKPAPRPAQRHVSKPARQARGQPAARPGKRPAAASRPPRSR